jgi:hypothetical protein
LDDIGPNGSLVRSFQRAGGDVQSRHDLHAEADRICRATHVRFHHWQNEGAPKNRYPRCELAEKKKTNQVGGSQWNTLGGNSENFTRPSMCHRDCTLYSPRSENGQSAHDQSKDNKDDDGE